MTLSTIDSRYVRPALSVISPQNHAGYLWIVTVLGLIYTFIVAFARVCEKIRMLGVDDLILGLATIFHMLQAVPVFIGLKVGLSQSASLNIAGGSAKPGQAFIAAEILAITVLCLAKCSVSASIIRVLTFRYETRWYICCGSVVLNAVWGLGSVVGLLVLCDSTTSLAVDNSNHCYHQLLRWKVITGGDVTTDILSFCTVLTLIWGRQMRKTLKVEILLVFSVRLLMVPLSILHLQSLFSLQRSDDPQLDITTNLVYLQVMLMWSIFSATIPNMRAFIKSFHSRLGMPAGPANFESLSLRQAFRTIRRERGSSRYSQPVVDKIDGDDQVQGSQPSLRPDIGRTTTIESHGDATSGETPR